MEVNGAIEKPTYDFLLVNNSEYMLVCSILRDIASQNMYELAFDLSRSLKVEGKVAIRKSTYDLRANIFALYRLTRARQKPGMGETPLLFLIHPEGSFRRQEHRQPHTPLGL